MKTCVLRDHDAKRQKEVVWLAFLTTRKGKKMVALIRQAFVEQYGYAPRHVFRESQSCWRAGPIISAEML